MHISRSEAENLRTIRAYSRVCVYGDARGEDSKQIS